MHPPRVTVSANVARRLGVFLGGALPLAGVLVFATHSAPLRADEPDYKALLEMEARSLQAVCASQCHGIQIVMDTPMSYDAWHETVQKMLDRGAVATDDQLQDIMDYLHQTMTRIDINGADAQEIEIVLNVSPQQAQAIVARRTAKKFRDLADLKSVSGLDAAALDAKARLISFQ